LLHLKINSGLNMKTIDIDQLLENPKNAKERVAVCLFLLITCPDTKKNEEELEDILDHMCEDLEELDQGLWSETHELAKQMAVEENMPLYQENKVWLESKLAELSGSVQEMEGVH